MIGLINFLIEKGFIEEAISLRDGKDILKLSEKNITDQDVERISELLIENTDIIQLDLFGNEISEKGAKAIAKLIQCNKALIGIDLGNNNIGKTGVNEIEKAPKINKTLIFLNLAWNLIENSDYKNIKKYLIRNANITQQKEIINLAIKFNEIDESKLLRHMEYEFN